MVLVDSSAWIHFLRPDGDADVQARVEGALRAGQACWCAQVRLELWNGAGSEREKRVLKDFERVLPDLAVTPDVWEHACQLARSCRGVGVSVPATDLLIMACAHQYGADLVHADAHFDQIVDAASGESRTLPVRARRR
jgi:predicted nucleic acid-binding protein